MEAQPFEMFGNSHLVTLLIIISIALLLPITLKGSKIEKKNFIAKFIGVSVILLEFIKPFIWHYTMDFPWTELIPIHMCNLSSIFVGIFLITYKRIFFEVSFFWGIGGGLNALITPDVPRNFPDPEYILFFFGHGILMIAILFACLGLKNRPTLESVKNGIYFSLATLPVIYVINIVIGPPANYWYLGVKPVGESLLDFFPEPPFHIPLLIILGMLVFYLIYSPFWIYDKFKKVSAV
tara:strand:+ start:9110 stop:9820 length:711 start_codon:yes stop_codon:yes gene_type:complete